MFVYTQNGTLYDFNIFKSSLEFALSIYGGKISWKEVENKQYKMLALLTKLKNYTSTNPEKIKSKK